MDKSVQSDLFGSEYFDNQEDDMLLICDQSCHNCTSAKSPRELFSIKQISRSKAVSIVSRKHYLRRAAPCSFAFALMCNVSSRIAGVIMYGTPSSAPLRSGICGEEESGNVIELTRLWIKDGTPKNCESFLIGNTIPLVNKEIIVSYAELQQGHVGTVYQATNWIYTGLSAKRTNWKIDGIEKHCQTIADKYSASEVRSLYGDGFSLEPRPQKHRYIYFNCNKRRRKQLMSKLRYQVHPYPKSPATP